MSLIWKGFQYRDYNGLNPCLTGFAFSALNDEEIKRKDGDTITHGWMFVFPHIVNMPLAEGRTVLPVLVLLEEAMLGAKSLGPEVIWNKGGLGVPQLESREIQYMYPESVNERSVKIPFPQQTQSKQQTCRTCTWSRRSHTVYYNRFPPVFSLHTRGETELPGQPTLLCVWENSLMLPWWMAVVYNLC